MKFWCLMFAYRKRRLQIHKLWHKFVIFSDYNSISKFLNRMLGMEVVLQNTLFKYFSNSLASIILEAKRSGRWDMGILGWYRFYQRFHVEIKVSQQHLFVEKIRLDTFYGMSSLFFSLWEMKKKKLFFLASRKLVDIILTPLKPHFYIVKLGFTGVNIIFRISAQNIDCGYSLEPPRRGGSNKYPQSMFWAETWKISDFIYENFYFLVAKFSVYLNRRVFVMNVISCKFWLAF